MMSKPIELDRRRSSRRGMLLLICTLVLSDFLATGILIPLIPPLVRQFNPQAFAVGLTFTVFAVGQFCLSPLLGVLSDRYGRKPILFASTLAGMLSCLVLGVANSLTFILISRFLDGLTGGNLREHVIFAALTLFLNAAGAKPSPAGRGTSIRLPFSRREKGLGDEGQFAKVTCFLGVGVKGALPPSWGEAPDPLLTFI